jgi:hypothetical protein
MIGYLNDFLEANAMAWGFAVIGLQTRTTSFVQGIYPATPEGKT